MDARRATPRPRSAALATAFAAGLLVSVSVAIAAPGPAPLSAPLDTLHVVAPPSPYDSADATMSINRNLLPDIAATSLPRVKPPQSPPRLDDPLAGEARFLAARRAARAGDSAGVQQLLDDAVQKGTEPARLRWWQLSQALRDLDPVTIIWALPKSLRAAWHEPLAAPRLLILAHQGAIQLLAIFWTLLLVAYYAVYWRFLAHDLASRILRDHRQRVPAWLPLLIVVAALAARPGWLGMLGLLSIPIVIHARGRNRAPLVATWFVALILLFPSWPPLREAVVALDPRSETVLLQRAVTEPADPALLTELREHLAKTDDPARRARLQIAVATQEARRGRFTASNDLLREALAVNPNHIPALVAVANNAYFQSRHDDAVAGYRHARELAPERGEIPYNLAQVYFKKLFVPEAGQALQDARNLGFNPPSWKAQDAGAFSPVIYLGFDRHELHASAQGEAASYPPLAHLAAWNAYLGVPELPPFVLLGALLGVALLLAFWSVHHDESRTCENCGQEICRECCLRRDAQWLCHACGETADRARSGMVLTTLLKNRSRAAGLSRSTILCRLASVLPGVGHLALGQPHRAAVRLFVASSAVFLIAAAWAFDPSTSWRTPGLVLAEETVHPLWLPLPVAAWDGPAAWPLGVGVILLLLIQASALVEAGQLRQRLPERLVQGLGELPSDRGRA
jgi:tetratricopeptide (TPR) repeat protein